MKAIKTYDKVFVTNPSIMPNFRPNLSATAPPQNAPRNSPAIPIEVNSLLIILRSQIRLNSVAVDCHSPPRQFETFLWQIRCFHVMNFSYLIDRSKITWLQFEEHGSIFGSEQVKGGSSCAKTGYIIVVPPRNPELRAPRPSSKSW